MELNTTVNRCSSEEEFEFPLPVLPTTEEGTGTGLHLQDLNACAIHIHVVESVKCTATNGVAKTVETTTQKIQQMETHRALDEALQHLDDHHWEQASGMYNIFPLHTEFISIGLYLGEDKEEDFEPSHLYTKVDKRRKVKREEERASDADKGQPGEVDWMERTCEASNTEDVKQPLPMGTRNVSEVNERGPPPLPPPLSDSDPRPVSGIYEEVEARSVQVPIVDSSGYTEVGGGKVRGSELGYEVGYSGIGSLHKLRTVLGPEFSTMTGGKVNDAPGSLPEGRRAVKVVLLNGKAVEFVIGVSATTSELFEQVASYQSLRETHVFGLAVRQGQQ